MSGFVSSSWELYRPELEAVTFPVFVHCYLTLVMFDHGTKVLEKRGMVAEGALFATGLLE